jgi:hypothetical protein
MPTLNMRSPSRPVKELFGIHVKVHGALTAASAATVSQTAKRLQKILANCLKHETVEAMSETFLCFKREALADVVYQGLAGKA